MSEVNIGGGFSKLHTKSEVFWVFLLFSVLGQYITDR